MKVLMLGWEFPPHISGGLGTACFGLTQGLKHHGVEVLFVVPRARGDEDRRFVEILGANDVPIEELVEIEEKRRVPTRTSTPEETLHYADAAARRRDLDKEDLEAQGLWFAEREPTSVSPSEREQSSASLDKRERWSASLDRRQPAAVMLEARSPANASLTKRETLRALHTQEYAARGLELIEIDSLLSPYLTETTYLARLKQHSVGSTSRAVHLPGTVDRPPSVVAELRAILARHSVLAFETDALERDMQELARDRRSLPIEAVTSAPETGPPAPLAPILAHGAHVTAQRASTPKDELETVKSTLVRARTLEFSGTYGPDLMAEVARFALAVGQVARTREFDVIHCHDWMTLPAGLMAARVSNKKLIFHVHACEYDRSGEHINERVRDIEQLGLDAADVVVCVSHYTVGILQQRYRVDADKLRVVHNAVTHKQFIDHLHEAKHIEEPIVLFLGRVTFQKGPDYFLEAAARVIEIEPRVKFVMSGSGDMLPMMIERAARLGLARNMHFTGFLKGPDVERMYAMADIYVMPSVSEPFGITPLEAMALDVPVIVSRQSGVSEVLRNALKVDFWDVQDIANKILALIRYPALKEQLTAEGRGEIQEMRWESPAALLCHIYDEVAP